MNLTRLQDRLIQKIVFSILARKYSNMRLKTNSFTVALKRKIGRNKLNKRCPRHLP